jgi:hypothetical protein
MANFTRTFTSGKMNKTYDERIVPDGEYIDAMNVRMGSTETSEIGVIENTKGNLALTQLCYVDGATITYLSADALCIGAWADTANDTLYWFVHDSNFVGTTGKIDLVVSFNILTNIVTYHIISINDGDDVLTTLNFNPQYLITGVNKVGDLLFFTDNYNPPRFINVTKNYPQPVGGYDNAGNPALLRESILVIKKPPIASPDVSLIFQPGENNYLSERFICFAYRYKYVDGEYSATSQWSAPAFFPSDFQFSPNSFLNEGMVNVYNAAVVTYETGGPLVVGIDLLFKQANNNIIKVIEKLDKALLGIGNNTTQPFTFNNSKIFTVLNDSEILRLYDNVPRFAKAQTIMGNRLMYGNYIEGYDLITYINTPTRIEYTTELISEEIGFEVLDIVPMASTYSIDGALSVNESKIRIELATFALIAGASITIELTFAHSQFTGTAPLPTGTTPDTDITFIFILANDYASVFDMVTSVEFQEAVGTVFNILPVYSPIPGDDTSCDGTTFTDSFNCNIPNILATPNAFGSVTKYASGITAPGEPLAIVTAGALDTYFDIQFVAMQFVDDPTAITQTITEYYKTISVEGYYQKISSPRSLHSNRGYEIAMVYMDEFNRSTTALVSPFNTEHVPCSASVNKNSITVTIPTSQRAPAWAKRYKFVCKADAENYETIYTSIFFIKEGTSDVYFLLQGENMRKVENGDRYIVKADSNGALLNCAYATVLEKEAQPSGFITTVGGAVPPAGVYMKIIPSGFQATQVEGSVIDPGEDSVTVSDNDYPILKYPMNIPDPANPGQFIDYTVPAGSIISFTIKQTRRGPGNGNRRCERRIYTLEVTLVSSANYDNMYDWFIGDNVEGVLDNGTSDIGSGGCAISNIFVSSLGTNNTIPTDVCANYYRFTRDATNNALSLLITGTIACGNSNDRESTVFANFVIYRAVNTLIFETEPTDTLPDIFFENDLSFPISPFGDHLSNGAQGDIDQDISSSVDGVIQTGFFNCFAFGNGVESYKIRDSIIGRSFNLGERVTTVAAQDYKEARRFADITYSGVYNQETNVNKLNEFNMGLLNFKNLETSFGDVQILDGRETDVLVLQEDKISYVLAGKNLLSDAGAGSALTSVPEVLGIQIARVEKYGVSFNPESYVQWGYDRFFTDVKRGAVIQIKGDSMQQDQLAVISEANMRTWFRDEFILSFNTQKLGGYDPYMNEYVLSSNERELPGDPECLECGIAQTFTLAGEETLTQYCVGLGGPVGLTTVTWTVLSAEVGADFNIEATYNGTSYGSGVTNVSGDFSFNKNLITETSAFIEITSTGVISLSIVVSCPVPVILNIIEVVVTADADAGKEIHTQYRYIDGIFVGPLQSNSVTFLTGTDPLVSRYSMSTGAIGSGAFPTDGSTTIMATNKIAPDDFDFDVLSNKFRYLRSSVLYANTAVDISSLLSLSTVSPVILTGPTVFQTQFSTPPTVDGDYLYLIWDLRNSEISNLCFDKAPESFQSLCCDCVPCTAECISYVFTNNSITETADIYLPSGLCADPRELTITLAPSEVVNLCIVNAPYSIVLGDVSIDFVECGCVPCLEGCQEYVVWTQDTTATINYIDCNTELPTADTLAINEALQVCVPIGGSVFVPLGEANVNLSNACGCCPESTCWTWSAYNPTASAVSFDYQNCPRGSTNVSVPPNTSVIFCADAYSIPIEPSKKLEFTVTSSCGCTL